MGPYVVLPPDGYLLDEGSGYTLVDAVTVLANDTAVSALYAGRSSAAVGVDVVRFQLPAVLPDAPFLTIRIRINGQESNTVLLPIGR